MSDLQELIASSSIKAFNQGVQHERERILKAIKFVSFDDDRYDRILAIKDLEEELELTNTGRNAT